ncbi:hypothetical protein PSTG_11359 [Puccinia striiformis f. sp. tritici PST-78]|uniref:Uncharacterized protein n=1 Tax=Puccinia striiformis f. sp. tritici PST-78 TaxID=1165861 RepID=A0A0L0V8E9_9BASI|nr:hypothetical protein PSTG_11359 [Puccinia striiformis f. sp. tritici PST-78]
MKASAAPGQAPPPTPTPTTVAMNAGMTAFLQVAANEAQLMAKRTSTHLAPCDPPGPTGNHTLEDYLTFIGCLSPEARRCVRTTVWSFTERQWGTRDKAKRSPEKF